AKLPVTPHDSVAFPKSPPAPLRALRERYGLGDALTGAIQSSVLAQRMAKKQPGARPGQSNHRTCCALTLGRAAHCLLPHIISPLSIPELADYTLRACR